MKETHIKPYLFEFQSIGNSDVGYISVAEKNNLPFIPKRVFWTYDVPPENIRGNHANKKIEEVIICVQGKIEIITLNNKKKETFVLDSPNKGLYIPPFTWTQIKFNPDSILLCLANDIYDEKEYIRDYKEFIEKYF